MNKKLTGKNLGKKCPECEEGFLFSVFRSENRGNGTEFVDQFIECDVCSYVEKTTNKRAKIHVTVD